jgi:hypothetical protein
MRATPVRITVADALARSDAGAAELIASERTPLKPDADVLALCVGGAHPAIARRTLGATSALAVAVLGFMRL